MNMGKRLLFIIPSLPDFVPYVYNYIKIAEQIGAEYDVICWNRYGDKIVGLPHNYFVYQHTTNNSFHMLRKMWEIYEFYRFAMQVVHDRHYYRVFIYTIADSVFFARWLTHKYRNRYVFDIRDYSPMIDSKLMLPFVKKLLRYSELNVISSEGFLHWLPKGYEYTLCHNIEMNKMMGSFNGCEQRQFGGLLRVLTIGAIRNANSNKRIVDALGNHDNIQLDFAGGGEIADLLKNYCVDKSIENVSFLGHYRKEEEDEIVKRCDFLNIVLPHDMISDYLMTNRFYLSVRLRKPMIVNEGNFQAEQVKKYGLGVIIYPEDDVYTKLIEYIQSFNWADYNNNCVKYMEDVRKDMVEWEKRVKTIVL